MPDFNMLFQAPNAGQAFAQAFQQGQQQRREGDARNALATLVQNPGDEQALGSLARIDPETAMAFRKQQIDSQKALIAQHQDNIIRGAQILRQFNPKDQASYTQALAAAQAAGIDVSEVPQQYDPQYVQGIVNIADALKPQNDVQMIPFTPGGGVVKYDKATGQVTPVVVPNVGGAAAGSPVTAPPPQAIARLRANPAEAAQFDEIFGAGAAQSVLGGTGGNVGGGFPGPH
jgi:hypothetical protein